MTVVDFEKLSDSELRDVSTDVFVTTLKSLPHDAIKQLHTKRALTEAQSGVIAAFLSMAPLMPTADPAAPAAEFIDDELFADDDTVSEAPPEPPEPAPESQPEPAASEATQASDNYKPLKTRMLAWWHGTDPGLKPVSVEENDLQVDEGTGIQDPNVSWSPTKMKAAQAVWGESFIEPGSASLVRKIMGPVAAEPAHTILDLSAGLGGTAFHLAKELNLWMEALEPERELLEKARDLAKSFMLTRRVPLQIVDYSTFRLAATKYDIIYSRERLFAYPQKGRIIKQAAMGLKPNGQILITDYMLKDPNCESESFQTWKAAESSKIFPWTSEQYLDKLRQEGFKIRATHDLSENILEKIHQGWHKFVKTLDSSKVDRQFVSQVIKEGEVWLARAKTLETGDVQVLRIHGTKSR